MDVSNRIFGYTNSEYLEKSMVRSRKIRRLNITEFSTRLFLIAVRSYITRNNTSGSTHPVHYFKSIRNTLITHPRRGKFIPSIRYNFSTSLQYEAIIARSSVHVCDHFTKIMTRKITQLFCTRSVNTRVVS